MDHNDINIRFTYHPPVGNQAQTYDEIRATARSFAYILDALVPDGREKALAITHLEETVMWANAGIARAPRATGDERNYQSLPTH